MEGRHSVVDVWAVEDYNNQGYPNGGVWVEFSDTCLHVKVRNYNQRYGKNEVAVDLCPEAAVRLGRVLLNAGTRHAELVELAILCQKQTADLGVAQKALLEELLK